MSKVESSVAYICNHNFISVSKCPKHRPAPVSKLPHRASSLPPLHPASLPAFFMTPFHIAPDPDSVPPLQKQHRSDGCGTKHTPRCSLMPRASSNMWRVLVSSCNRVSLATVLLTLRFLFPSYFLL